MRDNEKEEKKTTDEEMESKKEYWSICFTLLILLSFKGIEQLAC